MGRDHEHNPDPNQNAACIVGEPVDGETPLSESEEAAIQAAWEAWSGCIQNVDERGRTLLRVAIEAGWESGRVTRQGVHRRDS